MRMSFGMDWDRNACTCHFFFCHTIYLRELYQITALVSNENIAESFSLNIFLFNSALPNQQPENSCRTVFMGH